MRVPGIARRCGRTAAQSGHRAVFCGHVEGLREKAKAPNRAHRKAAGLRFMVLLWDCGREGKSAVKAAQGGRMAVFCACVVGVMRTVQAAQEDHRSVFVVLSWEYGREGESVAQGRRFCHIRLNRTDDG